MLTRALPAAAATSAVREQTRRPWLELTAEALVLAQLEALRRGADRAGRPPRVELRGARRAEGLKLTLLKAAAGGRGAWRTFWMSDRAWVDVVTMDDPDLSAARNWE